MELVEQRRDISAIKKIIIHCSDSDNPAHDDISVIRKWHIEERGFIDVGYHYFITKNGEIQKGRELWQVGAHCKGHNEDSIGICLSGKLKFERCQFKSCVFLIRDLDDILKIRRGNKYYREYVFPHNYFDKNKTCPNFDLRKTIFKINNKLC